MVLNINVYMVTSRIFVNPLRRDNPPSFMTGGVAGSQVTLCGE